MQVYEAQYDAQGRPERPHSLLAQARKKLQVRQDRLPHQEQTLARAGRRLDRRLAKLAACQTEIRQVRARLERFEQKNAANLLAMAGRGKA